LAERLFTPNGRIFNLGLFALVLEAVSAVALLATSAYLISRAAEQPPIMYLMMAVVGVRAFALGRAAFRYLQRLGMHDAVFAKLASLRPKLFVRLAKGDEFDSAESLERVTTDLDSIQNWTLRVLGPAIQAITAIVVASLLIAAWYPFSALATLAIAITVLVLMLLVSFRAIAASSTQRALAASELRLTLLELLRAAELIKSYDMLERYQAQIRRLEKHLNRTDLKSGLTLGFAASLMAIGAIIAVTSSASLTGLTLWEVPSHMLALAVLTPFAIFDVAANLQSAAISFHRFALARERLIPLVEDEETVLAPRAQLTELSSIYAQQLRIKRGEFELADISFSLPITGISVLMGPSGSGKTTIAFALVGLLRGVVGLKINGIEASELDPVSVRKQIVLIEQHPHMFLGTVSNNLAISGELDEESMTQALEQVGLATEFSDRGGLDLEISEGGSNISGGQAQRLAIARALLSGAKYLVLDEPTSGLDWSNAQKLSVILRQLSQNGIGCLVITHDVEFASGLGECNKLDVLTK
jgi:ATP-binding cassette subfamily C protein CydC